MRDQNHALDPTIGFIGAGKTATALGIALQRAGYTVGIVASRRLKSSEEMAGLLPNCQPTTSSQEVAENSDLVFVTTPDDSIGTVANSVQWRQYQAVVHCSGATSLDALSAARRYGADVASFHPLATFATVESALNQLSGCFIAIEAEGNLLDSLGKMASRLDCQAIHIGSNDKSLYHAAAVMSCGYIVTILQKAIELWNILGFSEDEAKIALTHLAHATVNNVATYGTKDAATGPVIRGDQMTIRCHLTALKERAPHLLPLYCHLAEASVSIAQQKRIIPDHIGQIRNVLSEFLNEGHGASGEQGREK